MQEPNPLTDSPPPTGTGATYGTHTPKFGIGHAPNGFVRRRELLEAGVNPSTIKSWLQTERLIHAWDSVYAVGYLPTNPLSLAFGATLAAGDNAAIASWSAAAFYGAVKRWPDPFELLSPDRCRVSGLLVHRSSTLVTRDVWRFDGLRVTSPARTALDLANQVEPDRLHQIVDHLRLRHHLSLDMISDVIERNSRHPGSRPLGALTGKASKRPTRSGLERRWPKFARTYGLEPYEQNVVVAGFEVDVLIDGLVVVELDTFGTHVLNFETDRVRDADILARTRIPVIRITDVQLDNEPAAAAAAVQATLAWRRTETRS